MLLAHCRDVRVGLISDEGARLFDELHPNLKACAEHIQLELERLAKLLPKHFIGSNIPSAKVTHSFDKRFQKCFNLVFYKMPVGGWQVESGQLIGQHVLLRACDVTLDVLAALACMARASRAKSIGLRHHDHELDLARSFTLGALKRIRANLAQMDYDKKNTNCAHTDHERIVQELAIRQGRRISHHPLACNE